MAVGDDNGDPRGGVDSFFTPGVPGVGNGGDHPEPKAGGMAVPKNSPLGGSEKKHRKGKHMKNLFGLLGLLGLASLLLAAGPAIASEWITEEPNNHLNQTETELHAVFGSNALGAGIRVGIPIAKQGFISKINNNVVINFGADILNWPDPDYGVTGVVVPVMLQWNFYLTRDWSVFAEGGMAFQSWFSQPANGESQTLYFWPGLSLGARYYFNPGNYPALVLRAGFPSGLTIGVSF
jgi:hypothetical protein